MALVAAAFLALGCGGERASKAANDSGEPRGELLVFAAASLTDAFGDIEADFEARYPGVDLNVSFAGSQSLRTQIQNGAQPQVFASANAKHMDALALAGLVDEPRTFAHNQLVIVVPKSNPAGITSLADLPKAERLVLAGPSVPAGAYAEKVLAKASSVYGDDFARRVRAKVVSRETHVRQTLQKVVLGEADAAMVYATDAASASGEIETIDIPAEVNVTASYPIAVLAETPSSELGQLFVDFVMSDAGKTQLARRGFRAAGTLAVKTAP